MQGDPMDGAEKQLFSVRLIPHRSLSRANFRILLIVFSTACVFTALPFLVLGAWPVAGFMGLDIALFYFAFRANYRDARAYEDVTVTPIELHISKVSPQGKQADWRFNPSWVRIEREDHEEYGTRSVAVMSRGRRLEVGAFLGPEAKADLATDLSKALAEARRGPRFDA
ncbi:MAG: DUF2244 domain-containing protein [Beijerinckiaceae bacterium]|nr:DUF2244 domain-containing protein [Beijerinckiaceae bacterium]MDO9443000.1 DUF2244 domain-containing protein [Beijerinckiaceae bacterium]